MICPMDTKTTPPAFLEWLDSQLRDHRYADSEAAMLAGLSHGAIYDVRNGQRPGVKKCRALARLFDVPEEYVLRLAGHLHPLPPDNGRTPEARYKLGKIAEIVDHLPPDIQDEMLDSVIAILQATARSSGPQTERERHLSD